MRTSRSITSTSSSSARCLSSVGGLIFGGGMHCLRSALDHCVYSIGVKEAGTDPPPGESDLMFPITADELGWKNKKWHVASLSDDAQAAIKRLQPHDSPDPCGMRPLGGLDEIDIADKHRALTVLLVLPVFNRSDISGGIPGEKFELLHNRAPIKEDTPFSTVNFDRPTPNVKVTHTLAFQPGTPRIRHEGEVIAAFLWDAINKSTAEVTRVLNELSDFC